MEDREMHKAVCVDCGSECEVPFKPTEGKPVRCKDCYRNSRPSRPQGRFSNNRRFDNRGPREMHKATCADCGSECEVPFKPTEGKPVRCMSCYRKSKEQEEY